MVIEHRYVAANNLKFHVAVAGRSDGPLVILLHGFPEFWYAWRHQIEPLAEAGFWVWAPDQRGYNLSDKPLGVEAYAIQHLADDVVALIRAAGREQAVLVGHDWGGVVVWYLAANNTEHIQRAVVINVPHPAVMLRQLRRDPRQLLQSWYIFAFQLPWFPERWLGSDGCRALARTLRRTSRRGTFSADELDRYREAWCQPHALTSMVNWYRAAMRYSSRRCFDRPIELPTLLIWGARDQFIRRQTAKASIDRCRNGRLVTFEEATHWVHHEESVRVNTAILEFLRG